VTKNALLNIPAEELPILLAALTIARLAASGYGVRALPERYTISDHWEQFDDLYQRVKKVADKSVPHLSEKEFEGKGGCQFPDD